MQTFAVAILVDRPSGKSEQLLYVLEAVNLDAAEGRAIPRSLDEGRVLRGLVSLSCDLSVVQPA